MRGGVWVSGPLQRTTLPIGLQLRRIRYELQLDRAQLSFRVADGSAGIIAGVTSTKQLIAGLEPGVRAMMCGSSETDMRPVLDVLEAGLSQSADLVDGDDSLQDPALPCDATSIGIGFQAAAVSAPDAVIAPLPPAIPADCAPKAP